MLIRNFIRTAAAAALFSAALAAQPQCGIHSVRGTWFYSTSGTATPAQQPAAGPLPLAMIGSMSIDGAGKVTGPGTVSWAGEVLDFDMVDGVIEVNADCTGVMKYRVKIKGTPAPVPGQYVDRVLVLPDRQEMITLTTASPLSKPTAVTTAKRISTVPSAVTWPASQ